MSAWALFMVFVTNQEKLSSSIMQQVMNTVRENPELREVLGEAIRPEPVWWMNGDPRIDGAVGFRYVHLLCVREALMGWVCRSTFREVTLT